MDNIQRLEEQADYIENNLAKWEAESVARIARRIGKIGRMSKAEAEKFNADEEAKKEINDMQKMFKFHCYGLLQQTGDESYTIIMD